VTIFQVHLSRGQAAAKALLGEFAGYLITDRWTGYGWWPLDRRQLCWAHLIREFQKIAERGGESQVIGEGLLAQARKLFELWHRVRDETLTRSGFAAAVVEIRASVQHDSQRFGGHMIRSVSTCKGCSVGEAIGDRALGGMSPEVYVQFWLKLGDPPVELSIGDEGQEEMIPEALTYIKDRAVKEINCLECFR
jgi:hypothetical protein